MNIYCFKEACIFVILRTCDGCWYQSHIVSLAWSLFKYSIKLKVDWLLFLSSQCNSGKFFITFSSQGLLLAALVWNERTLWIPWRKRCNLLTRRGCFEISACRHLVGCKFSEGGMQQSTDTCHIPEASLVFALTYLCLPSDEENGLFQM